MKELELYKGNRVTLMACSNCNAKCNDCYISYTGNRTPDDLYSVASSLINDRKHVRIDGAEILTNLEYLKTLELVGQNWIMTNGLKIYQDPSIVKLLKKYGINTVYMSYHFGIQKEIQSVSFDITDKVIEILKKNDFNIFINCTLTNQNYNDIISFTEQAYNMGVKGIGFNKIFQQGKANNIEKLDLTNEQLVDFFRDLDYVRKKYNPDELYITRGGSLGHDTFKNHDNFRCNAGHNKVMITPDSNVYSCNAMCKPNYEIGKFIDGKIYLYKEFNHDETMCLAELLGFLKEDTIENVNRNNFPKMVKKYNENRR